MLSVKRSASPTSESMDRPSKLPKVNVSFLKYSWRDNKEFDVDVKEQNKDYIVRVNSPGTTYPYRLLTPPVVVKWAHLSPGGNLGVFESSKSESGAKLSVTLNMSADNKYADECQEFLASLREACNRILKETFAKHKTLRNIYIEKTKSLLKGKKKKDEKAIEETALKMFTRAAKTPFKEKNGEVLVSASCKAFTRNDEEFEHRKLDFYKYKKQRYHPVDQLEISSNDLVGIIIQPVFYVLPGNSSFGITFRLCPNAVIQYKRSVASLGCTDEVLNDNMREYKFKMSKGNLYINDSKGRRYQFRTPEVSVKYCDLEEGTLNKFKGVTEATASLTATLESTPASAAWFDHFKKLCDDIGDYLFKSPDVLKDLKAEQLNNAKDIMTELDDPDQTLESVHKNMFLTTFKTPFNKHGLRVSQRMYSKMGVRQQIPVFDKDNQNTDHTVSPGDVIKICIEPSVYILPNGTCGVKCNIDLQKGINIVEGGDSQSFENKGLYDISDSDEED